MAQDKEIAERKKQMMNIQQIIKSTKQHIDKRNNENKIKKNNKQYYDYGSIVSIL